MQYNQGKVHLRSMDTNLAVSAITENSLGTYTYILQETNQTSLSVWTL